MTKLRGVLLVAPVLASAWAVGLWGAEPQTVACPVVKPERVPRELKATFSTAGQLTPETWRGELKALEDGRRDEECGDALRWLMHQPVYAEEVREGAFKVLAAWSPPWLFDDLLGMIEDAAQPESWRARGVQLLGYLHQVCPQWDRKTYEALAKYGSSASAYLRDAAIQAEAPVARDFSWRRNHPERFEAFLAQLSQAFAEARPASLLSALRAAAAGEATEKAAEVERLAGDAKQPAEIRVAAVEALARVARPESLAVLEALSKEGQANLAAAIQKAGPYVWVAQLGSATQGVRQKAFAELGALGESARPALERACATSEEAEKYRLAKTLLGNLIVAQFSMPPLDTQGLKRFGQNPAKANPGVPAILSNPATKVIVIDSEFPLESGPLEYVVVCKGENAKLHETVIAAHCIPSHICLALLSCGYVFAGEVRSGGKVNLPKGAGVMLSVEFQREADTPRGKEKATVRLPIEAFVWNNDTHRPMRRAPWAFTGSRYIKDDSGKQFLSADIEKSVAAIMVDPDAILNTPLDSADNANVGEDRQGFYTLNRYIVPRRGTTCRLIFEPFAGEGLKPEEAHDRTEQAAASARKAEPPNPPGEKAPPAPPPKAPDQP